MNVIWDEGMIMNVTWDEGMIMNVAWDDGMMINVIWDGDLPWARRIRTAHPHTHTDGRHLRRIELLCG